MIGARVAAGWKPALHIIEDFDILGITVRKEVVDNFFGYLAKYLCYDFVI